LLSWEIFTGLVEFAPQRCSDFIKILYQNCDIP
jgi:hypothetical protein